MGSLSIWKTPPILKDVAQRILSQTYETRDVQWRWTTEARPLTERKEVKLQEWNPDQTEEYSDGSRVEGAAAGGTTRRAEYLGQYATAMDAEMLGISLALESNYRTIALDSQAAITRTTQLYVEPARSWVELRVQKSLTTAPCTLMWVKGHSRVKGNEDADRRANLRAYGGRVTGKADIITPAGIRQDFPIHSKPKHLRWTRKAVKGLTYVITDRGPLRRWLKIIGRSVKVIG